MRVVGLLAAASLCFVLSSAQAQQPASKTPPDNQASASCGGGHTVDDYLAEKNKIRRKRNKNPLPSDTCIWGWCRETGVGPSDKLPTSHPPQDVPPSPAPSNQTESSSKPTPVDLCDPYSAAQDVEVGDFYYQDKSYRPALSRYESALKSKPRDPGIYLRLGKTAEKLGDRERAVSEYQSSIDAGPDQPSAKEAHAAIERIKSQKSSQ